MISETSTGSTTPGLSLDRVPWNGDEADHRAPDEVARVGRTALRLATGNLE
jgi:hypothetical protein